MSGADDSPGVFTVSLDTELAWGSFDQGGVERYGDAYRRTPAVVERLCDLFGAHEVPATWALVAHLLDDCEGHHEGVPDPLARWLEAAPCGGDVDRSLWYRPDLLETIRACETDQDIGLHGYSHLPVADHDGATVAAELGAAVDAARGAGIDPASFVFPRNRVGHVDLLAAHGVEVYRAVDARWYERAPVPRPGRRVLRFVDEAASLTPPTVVPSVEGDVVSLPGSQVFRTGQGAWRYAPGGATVRRATAALDRAAATGRVFHLWFHPFNAAAAPDAALSALDEVLQHAAELRARGDLGVHPMREVAEAARAGRWQGEAASAAGANTGGASS
jgi:peptidoglycan/xylan/chitin deacetylase (PgdA/CDA1 family)